MHLYLFAYVDLCIVFQFNKHVTNNYTKTNKSIYKYLYMRSKYTVCKQQRRLVWRQDMRWCAWAGFPNGIHLKGLS